jgi:PPM family protein phosphatase
MQCDICGGSTQPQDKFCEACGAPQAATTASPLITNSMEQTTEPAAQKAECTCGSSAFDAEGYCTECGNKAKPLAPIDYEIGNENIAWASHVGLRHTENQDCAGIKQLEDGSLLLVVSDGVCSAQDARAASHNIVQALLAIADVPQAGGAAALEAAIEQAHEVLVHMPYSDIHKQEPQATVVAALVQGRHVSLAWVGDSRAYAIAPHCPPCHAPAH